MKSEPSSFSIDDLEKRPLQIESWDGVRNYQARNFLQAMRINDMAFFYHSSCPNPGIVGLMQIVKSAYPDETAFDTSHDHYDPKSKRYKPKWFCVDVKFIKKFPTTLRLESLKKQKSLAPMRLLQKGNRLSVLPITTEEWKTILQLV